jgi:drug/metabolite transporter, DME family
MTDDSSAPAPLPLPQHLSVTRGRWCIVSAALLWSLSGGFAKILTQPTPLGLDSPPIDPLLIAFYRAFFAALVLATTLRRSGFSFRPVMIPMAVCFAVMNALFVSALAEGTAANAILLQYTAPMWMYLASVWWLGEPADRRSSVALLVGLVGIAILIIGGWQDAKLRVIAIALGSGITYAGVIVCLRVLRNSSSRWLTVLNHMTGALVLLPLVCFLPRPSGGQLVCLFLFGAVQMGLPYWLVARGLRSVSPQEAGTITLLEPLLNPLWAYLAASELPSRFTVIGGTFILGALLWRYWPGRALPFPSMRIRRTGQ